MLLGKLLFDHRKYLRYQLQRLPFGGYAKARGDGRRPNHRRAPSRQPPNTKSTRRREIGRFLAEAMKKVGNEGVITVEEAKSLETELDVVEGMQFDRGYISPYFVTNAEKMRAG
jgi:hypothetical protein